MAASSGFNLRESLRRVGDLLRRGVRHPGPDRETLLLIGKSALAATVAWVLADQVLQAPSSTFAPFSALLMVQVTVSRSLDQSVRYALAVVAGVLLAGLLSPLLGPTIGTFVLLMVISLILGRWRRLGSQGPQVAVAALFAYASFAQSGQSQASFLQVVSIAGLVLLGCGIGVVTNLAILPPMRYRSAEYSVRALTESLCDFLDDLGERLREGVPSTDQASAWRDQAKQFPDSVTQTRESIEYAAETLRLNPRRLLMRERPSFEGYRTIVNALDRIVEELRSVTRGLWYVADSEELGEGHQEFLRTYAEFVAVASDGVRALGRLHNTEDVRESTEVDDVVRRVHEVFDQLSEVMRDQRLDAVGTWPTFGALHTDGYRLMQDFADVRDELAKFADPRTS